FLNPEPAPGLGASTTSLAPLLRPPSARSGRERSNCWADPADAVKFSRSSTRSVLRAARCSEDQGLRYYPVVRSVAMKEMYAIRCCRGAAGAPRRGLRAARQAPELPAGARAQDDRIRPLLCTGRGVLSLRRRG